MIAMKRSGGSAGKYSANLSAVEHLANPMSAASPTTCSAGTSASRRPRPAQRAESVTRPSRRRMHCVEANSDLEAI